MATLAAQMGDVLRAWCAAAGLLCSTAFAQIQEGVWIRRPAATRSGDDPAAEDRGRRRGDPQSRRAGLRQGARRRLLERSADVRAVFAQRGYVVVLPLRRGFGATGGEFAEYTGSCSHPDYLGGEQAAAEDVMAAYEYARALPYVDRHRMILAGHSPEHGGPLHRRVRQPEDWWRCSLSRRDAAATRAASWRALRREALARVLDMVGRSIQGAGDVPLRENDQYFNPDTTRSGSSASRRRRARRVRAAAPFGDDGHYVFGDRRASATGCRRWRALAGTTFRSSAWIRPRRSTGNHPGPAASLQVSIRRAWPGSAAPASSRPRSLQGFARLFSAALVVLAFVLETQRASFGSAARLMLRPPG